MDQSEAIKNAVRKIECEENGIYFNKYFFNNTFNQKMLINIHHLAMQIALDMVYAGKITRLIINLPPGYTKTLQCTINFMARGLAINSMARFLHLSYSDNLALENSTAVRNIIKSEAYQTLWPIKIKDDSDSKKKWWTEDNGGVYATGAGGQVTGFRAGHMNKNKFTGALIIDDPVKPDDAQYMERIKVNERFNETIKSRLAHEKIPMIVIMQRIHKNDLSGYLLRGGSGEKWHHLNMAVIMNSADKYPKDYTHGIPIKHKIPNGWLWPAKHNEAHKISLMSHKRTFYGQYMQKPELYQLENSLWNEDLINQYRVHEIKSPIVRAIIGVDPSGDDGSENSKADAIGIIGACKCENGHYYVIQDKTLNGAPATWAGAVVNMYLSRGYDLVALEKNYGGAMVESTIRSVKNGSLVRCKNVTASRGKILRAEPIIALYEQGLVHHYGFLYDLEDELTTYDGAGKSPNRLDALVWALTELSGGTIPDQTAPEVGL